MPRVEQTERELPLIQRGIVDNCFEEGHYEYGIGVLDRLRANRYKPFPLHIRQLLFIALYPPPSEHPQRGNRADSVPSSPQKVQLQRQKDNLWPKPTSRPLSIALLNALVSTNSPESLMRGIPYYHYVDNHGAMDVDPFGVDRTTEDGLEDNSPLKQEVLALQRRKDCWELLKDGVVKRKQADRFREDVIANLHANDVVGPYAWPVLEWLIRIFEKDERRAKEQGQAPHSALLLCQIPSPREKKGPRWDVEVPLKVAFACFLSEHQAPVGTQKYASSEKRIDLGARLISLLTNLTLTKPPLLSPSHFLRFFVQGLPELSLPSFECLLATIPFSQAPFKIALLESYLSRENGTNLDNARPIMTSRVPGFPKPKFTGKGASMLETTSAAMSTNSQDRNKDAYPVSTPDSLFKLLASPLPSPPVPDANNSTTPPPSPLVCLAAKIALAKYQMVSLLWTLRISHRLADTDSRWITAVREGRLRTSVEAGFTFRGTLTGGEICGGGEIGEYLSQVLKLVGIWEDYSG